MMDPGRYLPELTHGLPRVSDRSRGLNLQAKLSEQVCPTIRQTVRWRDATVGIRIGLKCNCQDEATNPGLR